jgi:hypothetical protein
MGVSRGTPFRIFGFDVVLNDLRARSDRTWPRVLPLSRAISFAMAITSSSISTVVRTSQSYHVTHQTSRVVMFDAEESRQRVGHISVALLKVPSCRACNNDASKARISKNHQNFDCRYSKEDRWFGVSVLVSVRRDRSLRVILGHSHPSTSLVRWLDCEEQRG